MLRLRPSCLVYTSLCAILVVGNGCQNTPQESPQLKAVALELIAPPDISVWTKQAIRTFIESTPKTDTGNPITVNLIEENSWNVAPKIARGEIKAQLWISPFPALAEYVNKNIKNLGAEQVDCAELFSTPLVIATNTEPPKLNNIPTTSIALRDTLLPTQAGLLFSHAYPRTTDSGFLSALFLNALVLGDAALNNTKGLSVRDIDALRSIERRFSRYANNDKDLLSIARRAPKRERRFVLTSEQKLIDANQVSEPRGNQLTALYPSEGTLSLQYTLCRSETDWTTPEQRKAAALFLKSAQGEQSQKNAADLGFRPQTQIDSTAPRLAQIPVQPILTPNAHFMKATLNNWESVERPEAYVIAIDSSGSMSGTMLTLAKSISRLILGNLESGDIVSTVSFSAEPQVLAEFGSSLDQINVTLDDITAAGGTAAYDALTLALKQLRSTTAAPYRKHIVILTDGDDRHSQQTLSSLIALLSESMSTDDFRLTVLAMRRPQANYADLQQLAEVAFGKFLLVDEQTSPRAILGILEKNSALYPD